jgi:hypothetical protein
LWEDVVSGKGIVVAILDGSCSVNHPDMMRRIIEGMNFFKGEEHLIIPLARRMSMQV